MKLKDHLNEGSEGLDLKNRVEVSKLIKTMTGWIKDLHSAYEYGNFSQAIIAINNLKKGPLKDLEQKIKEDQRTGIIRKKEQLKSRVANRK